MPRSWLNSGRVWPWLIRTALIFSLSGLVHLAASRPGVSVAVGSVAPVWTLSDIAGLKSSLSDYTGKPLIVFFFCGCEPCHDFAHLWAQVQRSGELPHTATRLPSTVVIYQGDRAGVRAFTRETGLEEKQTNLLADPDSTTERNYQVVLCPRIFVLDKDHRVVYTNPEPAGATNRLPAAVLVSRTLKAWRGLSAPPPPPPVVTPAQPTPTNAPHLTITGEPGLTVAGTGIFHFDAGRIDPLTTSQWRHVFTVRNDTKKPITIGDLRGSCGCETLLLTKKGSPQKPMFLAPGEQAQVDLSIALNTYQSGAVRKYVWAYPDASRDQTEPLTTIEVDLDLHKSISFSPTTINFGTVGKSVGGHQALTVVVDAGVATKFRDGLPPLVSDVPLIQVATDGRLLPTSSPQTTTYQQAYTVTLATDAPSGPINANLRFAKAPLASISLVATGTVQGNVAALPSNIFFGSIPRGSNATRSVIITCASPGGGELTITSDMPWVSTTLSPATSRTFPIRRLLSVRLHANAPLGVVQAEISVRTASGEVLRIPITAELTGL